MNFLHNLYLSYLSQPAQNRCLYKYVLSERPRRIVELGIQRGDRTEQLIKLAVSQVEMPEMIEYCCSDPFENRSPEDGPGISLRRAFKKLNGTGADFRSFAMEPDVGIYQIAKLIKKVDMLIIATPNHDWIFERMGVFAPMLHDSSGIFLGFRENLEAPYHFERIDRVTFMQRFYHDLHRRWVA